MPVTIVCACCGKSKAVKPYRAKSQKYCSLACHYKMAAAFAVGAVVGRLTLLKEMPRDRNGKKHWVCQCSCGKEVIVFESSLVAGSTNSCGCLRKEVTGARCRVHGKTHQPVWESWYAMRRRCLDPTNPAYPRYGGRGIQICERWSDFATFLLDMGEKPPGMTLERIDNAGNYTPENCRWATRAEQNRNKRSNRILEFNGEQKCVADWADFLNVTYATIENRLRRGWSIEKTLTTPQRIR